MEKRILGCHGLRSIKTDKGMCVRGYAASYGVLSHPLPGNNGSTFRERIAKGAFDGVLADPKLDCVALWNHDQNMPLGRTTAGTLKLRSDSKGLAFDCDLPNTSYARDLYESVKRGDTNGCSFAFQLGQRNQDENWEEEEIEDEKDLGLRGKVVKALVRTIRNFQKLMDISLVTSPAYPGTSVDARNILVGAEVRSYVENRIHKLRAPQQRFGWYPSTEDPNAPDALEQKARRDLFDLILE